jgi:hypothetical protein
MDHFHTFAADIFARMALPMNILQIFVKENLIFTSICFIGVLGLGMSVYMWTSQGKRKCDMSNTKASPVDLPEPVSVFPPGIQIDNVIKEWASSGMGALSGVAQKMKQKRH